MEIAWRKAGRGASVERLGRIARADYGDWLLVAVAGGLLAYGLFCFMQARYRRV